MKPDAVISIIIPIYNTQDYLEKCLKSVIEQTYNNLEIICVDDGSTDSSGKILEEYSKQDSRIKIVTQANKGLSSARNIGLEYSTGEYVGFVDSDDWCAPDMYEKLYHMIKNTDADFAMCGVTLYDDSLKRNVPVPPYFSLTYFDPDKFAMRLEKNDFKKFFFGGNVIACNKLFCKKIFHLNSLRFHDGAIYEDQLLFVDLYFLIESFSLIAEPLYHYRINRSGSIMKNSDLNMFHFLNFINYLYNIIGKNILNCDEGKKMWIYIFNAFDQFGESLSEKYKGLFYYEIEKFLCKNPINDEILAISYVLQSKKDEYSSAQNLKKSKTLKGLRWRFFQEKTKDDFIKYYLCGICYLKKDLQGRKYLFKLIYLPWK